MTEAMLPNPSVNQLIPHLEIILEALYDYRRWFRDDAADSDNLDQLKIDAIDGAIACLKRI